jgi:hypothetical protein
MKYDVVTIPPFDKEFKRLAKKYPFLKAELATLVDELASDPDKGTAIGRDCYKIRLSIASKGKGKSGGARVVTHCAVTDGLVILLSIYDKSEQSDISDKELLRLLNLAR